MPALDVVLDGIGITTPEPTDGTGAFLFATFSKMLFKNAIVNQHFAADAALFGSCPSKSQACNKQEQDTMYYSPVFLSLYLYSFK